MTAQISVWLALEERLLAQIGSTDDPVERERLEQELSSLRARMRAVRELVESKEQALELWGELRGEQGELRERLRELEQSLVERGLSEREIEGIEREMERENKK